MVIGEGEWEGGRLGETHSTRFLESCWSLCRVGELAVPAPPQGCGECSGDTITLLQPCPNSSTDPPPG